MAEHEHIPSKELELGVLCGNELEALKHFGHTNLHLCQGKTLPDANAISS